MSKPDTHINWTDGDSSKVTEPSTAKKLQGWIAEEPGFQHMNWIQYKTDLWTKWSEAGIETIQYNVKDYGAVGDSSNDDTSAIQNAIDTAAATISTTGDSGLDKRNMRIVYIPASSGDYKITDLITVPLNIAIECDGIISNERSGNEHAFWFQAGSHCLKLQIHCNAHSGVLLGEADTACNMIVERIRLWNVSEDYTSEADHGFGIRFLGYNFVFNSLEGDGGAGFLEIGGWDLESSTTKAASDVRGTKVLSYTANITLKISGGCEQIHLGLVVSDSCDGGSRAFQIDSCHSVYINTVIFLDDTQVDATDHIDNAVVVGQYSSGDYVHNLTMDINIINTGYPSDTTGNGLQLWYVKESQFNLNIADSISGSSTLADHQPYTGIDFETGVGAGIYVTGRIGGGVTTPIVGTVVGVLDMNIDGERVLKGANLTMGDGKYISVDQVRARDGNGLALYDDSGKGIFVRDGGDVLIGTTDPTLHAIDGKVVAIEDDTNNPGVSVRAAGTGAVPTIELDADRPNEGHLVGRLSFYNNGAAPITEIRAFRGTTDLKGVLAFYTSGAEKFRIDEDGTIGLNTTDPTISGNGKLHMDANTWRLEQPRSPAPSSTGNVGEQCWDADHISVCTATDIWKYANYLIPQEDMVNLVIQNNNTNPNYQIDIDVDKLACEYIQLSGVNLTLTMDGTTGANKRDTGFEATSTWYYIWVIYNLSTSTTAGLFSESVDDPTMPSGYTLKRLIGAVYNDANGDGDFITIKQRNKKVACAFFQVTTSAPDNYTEISLAVAIPSNAIQITGVCEAKTGGNGRYVWIRLASEANGLGELIIKLSTPGIEAGVGAVLSTHFILPITTTQKMYYKRTHNDTINIYVRVSGWEY